MLFRVKRFDPSTQKTSFTNYDVRPKPGMTVLGALFHIQNRLDDSLAFRYACRGAVCGSCAMLINKVPRLACRTQLKDLTMGSKNDLAPYPGQNINEPGVSKGDILVEPLSHLHVIKDLVVDMRKFFRFFRTVEPALRQSDNMPEREFRVTPAAVQEFEPYTNCILCAACYGACPVAGRNPDYLGPAALAKLYRFAIDPRENPDGSRLLMADNPNGWPACKFYHNCKRVCPKDVPPDLAIGHARQMLKDRVQGIESPVVQEVEKAEAPGSEPVAELSAPVTEASVPAASLPPEAPAPTEELPAPDDSPPWAGQFWKYGR